MNLDDFKKLPFYRRWYSAQTRVRMADLAKFRAERKAFAFDTAPVFCFPFNIHWALEQVCRDFGIDQCEAFRKMEPDLDTFGRNPINVRNRWRVWEALIDRGYSGPEIARATGAPNHSTIFTAVKNARMRRKEQAA